MASRYGFTVWVSSSAGGAIRNISAVGSGQVTSSRLPNFETDHTTVTRRPFGARGMSSVRYGTRLGDLKNKQSTHTHSTHTAAAASLSGHRVVTNPGASNKSYRVCFITAGPITFAWGGRRVEDMCYERRRAEACVD